MPSPRLLVLSNGHGEDLIALRLIEALRRQQPALGVHVLPLVGEGQAFAALEAAGELQRVGPHLALPSGGFSNQSLRGLLGDLAAGLPLLSWRQWRIVRDWGRQGLPILAVGDLLPLLLAWAGGGPYGFLGTPKSDHTWASPPPPGWGRSPLADGYHRAKGSEWDPWEWALMGHRRCRLVAVRDRLTARGLRRHGVGATAPGNPMMDGFAPSPPLPAWLQGRRRLLLLPGSRLPEAMGNLRALLAALPPAGQHRPISVLLATGARPSAAELAAPLTAAGFAPGDVPPRAALPPPCGAGARSSCWWVRAGSRPGLPWRSWGWPPPARPPSSWWAWGCRPCRCQGPVPSSRQASPGGRAGSWGGRCSPATAPRNCGDRLITLLDDDLLRARLGRIGRRRMGPAGGSERLATLIRERLLAGPRNERARD